MKETVNVVMENYDGLIKNIANINKQSEKAVQRTISDFKSRGPGWISQEIVKEYNIKKKDVNEAKKSVKKGGNKIKVAGTRVDNLSIVYWGRPLTLTHFGMTPRQIPRLTDKRVTAKIGNQFRTVRTRSPITVRATIKKGNTKVIKGEYDEPIFIAENPKKAGQYLPFQRRGKERTPVDVIKTVSVPQMVTNEKVAENIHGRINEELGKRLEHHLKTLVK